MNGESQFPAAKRLIGELREGQTIFVLFFSEILGLSKGSSTLVLRMGREPLKELTRQNSMNTCNIKISKDSEFHDTRILSNIKVF